MTKSKNVVTHRLDFKSLAVELYEMYYSTGDYLTETRKEKKRWLDVAYTGYHITKYLRSLELDSARISQYMNNVFNDSIDKRKTKKEKILWNKMAEKVYYFVNKESVQ